MIKKGRKFVAELKEVPMMPALEMLLKTCKIKTKQKIEEQDEDKKKNVFFLTFKVIYSIFSAWALTSVFSVGQLSLLDDLFAVGARATF